MTINERIKYLRKKILKMNQTTFGEKIGMAQTGVSSFESQGGTVTESTIKSISLVFGISEDWLRYGTEPMYCVKSNQSFEEFLEKYHVSDVELAIINAYLELDVDTRQTIVQHFKERLAVASMQNTEETATEILPTVEEAEREYIKKTSSSAPKTTLSAISTTKDKDIKKVSEL